jgi:hypothetical protein
MSAGFSFHRSSRCSQEVQDNRLCESWDHMITMYLRGTVSIPILRMSFPETTCSSSYEIFPLKSWRLKSCDDDGCCHPSTWWTRNSQAPTMAEAGPYRQASPHPCQGIWVGSFGNFWPTVSNVFNYKHSSRIGASRPA